MSKAKPLPVEIVPSLASFSRLAPTGQPGGAEDKAVGAKLTLLYHEAEAAELAILRFGAAFWAVEQIVLATCGQHSTKSGPGNYGFASWLAENAPEISRTTARRYRDLAEATARKFQIADPVKLFGADVSLLAPAELKQREKVVEFVADKSMRAVQLELGLVTTRGGDNTPRDADGKRLPAAAPKELLCPPWATEGDKALWATLGTERARLAFIDWRPRIAQLHNQAADIRGGFLADLDEETKGNLIDALVATLGFLAPHTLKRAPKA